MMSKPFSLLLVYILTIINFLFLILPFFAASLLFIEIYSGQIIFENGFKINIDLAMLMLISIISGLMILYLFFDFIFGFSISYSLKNCKNYKKLENYFFLQEIFDEAKYKFNVPNAKLYIKNSDEINAFAVGNIRNKAIILSSGLINHYAQYIEDDADFLLAIRSIIGHEMSHLINKDFLSGLLIITNQKVTDFICSILFFVFKWSINIAVLLRLKSYNMAGISFAIYGFINKILNLFNRFIVNNIYEFLKNYCSRQVEYRCDKQSAKAFGGINMALALSLLGKSGYMTIFSTHPSTARRIKKVQIIEEKNCIITPSIFNELMNFISLMILPIIFLYSLYLSNLDQIFIFYFYHYFPEIYFDFNKIL